MSVTGALQPAGGGVRQLAAEVPLTLKAASHQEVQPMSVGTVQVHISNCSHAVGPGV